MASPRDPWLDNVKILLVTLVVIGHTLPQISGTEATQQTYDFIYFFHIPAFVLLTGHLSRSFTWSKRHLWSLFCTCAVPYLMFEPLLLWWRRQQGEQVSSADLWLVPHWAMWYLLAVLVWRLATPLLRLTPWVVPLSVLVSIGVGFFQADEFALHRILALLPFFVIGLHLTPERLALLRTRWLAWPALLALGLLWWCAGRTEQWFPVQFLWWDRPFDAIGVDPGEAIRITVSLILVALLATAAVLVLVPTGRRWFSSLGAATMVVYLGHGFPVTWAKGRELFEPLRDGDPWVAVLAVVLFGTTVALVLASPPVRTVGGWAVDPIGSWQRHRRSLDVGRSSA
jgi:fucose 4-O-acetylase-like acetyltransferase